PLSWPRSRTTPQTWIAGSRCAPRRRASLEGARGFSRPRRAARRLQPSEDAMTLWEQLSGAEVFDLEQPRFAGMPIHPAHKPGYFYALHRRHRDTYRPKKHGPRSGASGVLTMMEHSGTHIDALCHQACDLQLHKGIAVEDVERTDGFTAYGAETMAPLIARGVLLDVARWKQTDVLPPHYAITAEDLSGCARENGVEVKPRDVLLLRTGFATCWNEEEAYLNAAGVSKSGNIWAAEQRVQAVGADNM